LVYKKIGIKQTLILLLFVAVLISFTDQVTNLFKNHFQRLRPCNDSSINSIIRVVKGSNSYSFFSGHAANTSAVALFLFLNFRKKYKYFGLIFIWPMIFAYSRIYLGLHFPIDILTGYFFGTTFGLLMFKIYRKIIVS
jgi:undecaprenyl-diphosphatase